MENPPQPSKDLHYLITRIINPILNSIIATLHDNSVVHYKDWSLDVKEYTTPEVMAKFLEDWRNELWHKYYNKNLSEVSEEILYDYMRAIKYVYTRLYNQREMLPIAEEIKTNFILLGQKIEKYLTGKVEVFSNFMFDVEKSKPLQMEKPQEMPKSQTKPGKLKEEESLDFGVCSRCAVYDGDKSKKKLYQCPYCGEWFCEKHIRPSLVLTFQKYQELWINHKDLRDFLDKEWHREDGHPCYPYTQKFWQEYDWKNTSLYGIGKSSSPKEIRVSGTWFPKNYTRYDNVIINVKKRLKDWGSVYVTPKEIYIETSTIKKVIPRSPSIRFEIRDGERWIIIPEDLYLGSTSTPKSTPSIRSPNIKHSAVERGEPLPKKDEKQKINEDITKLSRQANKRQEKPGRKKQKSKGKYIAVGVVILLLILVGYLYSQGSFDNIGSYTQTTATSTPPTYIPTENTLFLEDFEKYPIGEFPSGDKWRLVWSGKGREYQIVTNTVSFSGDKSLQLWGISGWSAVAERMFYSSSEVIGFETKIYIEEYGTHDQKMVARVLFWNKELDAWGRYYAGVYFQSNGKVIVGSTPVAKWMPKTWYHLKVILDRSTKTFSVYLNGKLIAKDVTAYSPDVENINAIVLISDHAGVKVYYDDVKVFELSQTPYTSTLTQTYIPTQTYTQTLPITSESYCSNGYWRYIFEDALKCALTEEELSRISNLANQLKGETIQESAWNILEWLDKNIEYDYYKASLPAPIIWKYPDGRIKEVTGGEGTEIQTPYETIQRGKGVCSDYTILTTALLLEMGYSPVYVFDINFENSETGHTATAIKINGEYFILDQHPPVMDLGTYYTDLSTYRQETLGERLFISNATIYEVKKDRSGVLVEKVETLSAEDFKQRDYKFSFVDITKISEDLKRMFKEHYHNLILDTNIANLDKRSYLPVGYSDGVTWRMEFPHYADFYNPVFHEQFVEYLFTSFTDDLRLKYDLQRFNRFWVKLEQEGDSLKIILNLAKK